MNIERITNSKYLPLILITFISFILYSNSLANDFLYDDIKQVLNNPWITDIKYIPEILFSKTWGFDPTHTSTSYYRPVLLLVFMAEYFIFGLKPWGWHLTNIVFHALNGIFAFLLFNALFSESTKEDNSTSISNRTLSFLAALIFIAHPVRTEVVAWVSAIPELSFTLFLLISLYLYTLYRDNGKLKFLIVSAGFFFLSTLSKETSLVLPILIVAFDIIFRDRDRDDDKLRIPFRYIPYIIVIIVYFALRINALDGLTPRPGSHSYLSGFEYFLNIFPLFIDHMLLLAVPIKLSIYHVFHPSYSLTEARLIISVIVTIIIITVIIKLKKTDRLYLFALALVVLPLLPALYIPALDRNPFAERYLYLSGTGFALFVALILRETYDYHCEKGGGRALTYIAIPFIILITLYSIGTIKRNFDWKSRYTLWNSAIRVNPQNYFALMELGNYYLSVNDTSEAIPLFERSIEANRAFRNSDPLILGLAHLSLANSLKDAKRVAEAIEQYKVVLQMDPARFGANLNIALLYHEQGDLKAALTHYRTALKRADKEDSLGILMNIGNIFAKRKQWNDALKTYSRALKITPDDPTILNNIGLLLKERLEEREKKNNQPRRHPASH